MDWKQVIQEFIRKIFELDNNQEINLKDTLFSDLKGDSLMVVMLCSELELKFNMGEIPLYEFGEGTTVEDVVNYVKLNAQ